MNNGRDCKHGRRLGSCDSCDLEEAEVRISHLEAERDALAAQVEVLTPLARRCLWGAIVWNDHNFDPLHTYCRESTAEAGVHTVDQANTLLESTPTQCLAEIKAQAGRAGFLVAMQNYASDTTSIEDEELADHYAESIRRGEV